MARCTPAATADVDGDGADDEIALGQVNTGRWLLRVLVADGSAAEYPFDTATSAPITSPWHGAAVVDGAPGAEIALLTDLGAHTMWFTVLTYRDGQLTELGPPPAEAGQAEGWVVDSADSGWLGYTCGRSGPASTLLVTSARRIDGPSGAEGYDETSVLFGWAGSGWQEISRETRAYGHADPDTHRLAGWNCEGLPRFARE
ncbi:hypothetical protein CC117_22205 [Parafrankia colletiae]|uniref:Uncharacterized protein n=1 Tax=Parafrankia colletiae TaxID=573497 RepID=A0A1S1QGW9_9ACTN|nr:hypothetical protein [Parafrankia colletiae]MCK9901788.1 hypothetical protein [Frankia sp. Cpl3]OHV34023.1 hypothetical protein CC117_22205 [Parafrankia colletiae]